MDLRKLFENAKKVKLPKGKREKIRISTMNHINKEFYNISFGGIESEPDYRDIPLTAVVGEPPKEFPDSYFADIGILPVWHQKKIGACVGFASVKKKQKADYDETKKVIQLSPRFVYAIAKATDRYMGEGTYYRFGVKILQQHGCATEATIPNDSDLPHEEYVYDRDINKIPKSAFEEAKQYAIKSYAAVGLSDPELKQAIMEGNGILLGMQLGTSWWTDKRGNYSWREQDILPLRSPASIISGHAIYLYGWETINGRTLYWFLNSWSEQWGRNGRGSFFYDEQRPFLTEAWAFVDLPNDWIKEAKDLPPANIFRYTFHRDIVFGEKSEEVRSLQIALKIDGTFPKTVAETGFYGTITQKAVKDFQIKYKVASWSELLFVNGRRVGPKTRSKLNELFSD